MREEEGNGDGCNGCRGGCVLREVMEGMKSEHGKCRSELKVVVWCTKRRRLSQRADFEFA